MTKVSPLARLREGSNGSNECQEAKTTILRLTKRAKGRRMKREAVQYQAVVQKKSYLVAGRKTVQTL